MDNLKVDIIHDVSLKYALEKKDKKLFQDIFERIFQFSILMSISKYEEIKYPLKGTYTCWDCGKEVKLLFDGEKIYQEENDECFNERVFSFDIKVPSGKLLLNDWIAYGNNIFGIIDENVNYLIGKYKESKRYAELNCLHMFVGNTCPSVMQKDDTIYIELSGYNEEDDESIFTDNSFEKKGFICTDLWWTTGIDLEYYYRLLEKVFGKDMRNDEEVKSTLESGVILNITPGTYRCTSFYDICNRDSNEPQIFIKIEKM